MFFGRPDTRFRQVLDLSKECQGGLIILEDVSSFQFHEFPDVLYCP
jgi:hypothetical protein